MTYALRMLMMLDTSFKASTDVELLSIESLTLLNSFLRSSNGAIVVCSMPALGSSGFAVSITTAGAGVLASSAP